MYIDDGRNLKKGSGESNCSVLIDVNSYDYQLLDVSCMLIAAQKGEGEVVLKVWLLKIFDYGVR